MTTSASAAAHRVIDATLARHAAALCQLAVNVHQHPELGFQETQACLWQTELLARWGFRVITPFAGLPTAYKAVAGRGAPTFCVIAEYDALPDIGHACGHNLICAAALGAGVALAKTLRARRARGTIVVMGTPAEESHGGKLKMLRKRALDGIDAVVMAHPSHRTAPDMGSNAITRCMVTFHGKEAHAAAAPELGLNALDAVMLLFHGVNAWRQQLPEGARIHGVVKEGGVMPNIIPGRATCVFYLRAPDDAMVAMMATRFRAIARGAALMTGTRVSIKPWLEQYQARKPNQPLNDAFVEAARAVGLPVAAAAGPGRASSDFGNVSQVVPGIHPYFDIARTEIPGHSIPFRTAAGSEFGRQQMLKAAAALARVGWRFLSDAQFRAAVRKDFTRP